MAGVSVPTRLGAGVPSAFPRPHRDGQAPGPSRTSKLALLALSPIASILLLMLLLFVTAVHLAADLLGWLAPGPPPSRGAGYAIPSAIETA